MFLLAIIILTIHSSLAKVYLQPGVENELSDFDDIDIVRDETFELHVVGEPLWVLRLNSKDWIDPQLELGNAEEQEDFYDAIGPMSARRIVSRNKNNTNNASNLKPSDKKEYAELFMEIIKTVNKFALSINSNEPDTYLRESADETNPSIALYFKGPYKCLVVKLGTEQWHYVLKSINTFPEWFNQSHDTFDSPLAIPEEVKTPFYRSLLYLLRAILNHPL